MGRDFYIKILDSQTGEISEDRCISSKDVEEWREFNEI